ncbi:MAG: Hpt domain-containing protein [Burkholderiales bacterium]|jgi:chemosensory pili system protein ChpA (sensor histidine kinase/response regulator)|nr:Hpt domain-containing protein [Burkholderiales bacterium]
MSRASDFDIGPLTWVKGEIDQALERSAASLRAYAANPDDATQVRFSQTHFHQAHGALQIVGLDGVTRLSEELEGLLGDVEKSGNPPTPAALAAADAAFAAITTYLGGLLAGEPNQPLRLFGVYKDLVAARGKDAPDPVDLYFPDLAQRPPRRDRAPVLLAAADGAAYYKEQRGRYQRGLLKWIKKDASGAEDMRAAVAAVEAAQTAPQGRAFWWVALGFFDALVARALPDDPRVARLANRIEQQIKRLMEGSATVSERLMREALFQVARARPATEHLRAVHEVYGLAGSVPATFDLKPQGEREQPALAALRELVVQAKTAWNKYASGHAGSLTSFGELAGAIKARAVDLGNRDLVSLTEGVAGVAQSLASNPERASDAVAMETATTLLLVENAVEKFGSLSPEFSHQAQTMRSRLDACARGEPPPGAPQVELLDEMSRRAQERLLMAQVVAEIQANLRAIEQSLDAFFRDPAKRGELPALDRPVKQVLGALTMLNEDRAAGVLADAAQHIGRFAAPDYAPVQADFEAIAGALSGLGFYVDALQHGRADFDTMMKPLAPAKLAPVEEGEVAAPQATVEEELAQAKKRARTLFDAWRESPGDAGLRAELERSLAAIQKDSTLVADAALEKQAAGALELFAQDGIEPLDAALQKAMSAITGAPIVAAAPSAETAKLAESSTETIDAELLAIFLEEATEVLDTIRSHLEAARAQPQSTETLRTIRRGFHTLKGSGRMVGLTRLGEAAWGVEQVMNRWLEEERAATPDLFKLIGFAHAYFATGVAQLKAGGASPDEREVVAAAERLKRDESLADLPDAPGVAAVAPALAAAPVAAPEAPRVSPPEPVAEAVPALDFALPEAETPAEPAAETPTLATLDLGRGEDAPAPTATAEPTPSLDFDFALPETAAATPTPSPEPAALEPLDFAVPAAEAPEEPEPVATAPAEPAEEVVRVGDVELSPALYGIFVAEAHSHLATLRAGVAALASGEPVSEPVLRAAHTLAGIAGTVRFDALHHLSHALEIALGRHKDRPLANAARLTIAETVGSIEVMVAAAERRELPVPAPELVARLDTLDVETAPAEPEAFSLYAANLDMTTAVADAPAAPAAVSEEQAVAEALDFSVPPAPPGPVEAIVVPLPVPEPSAEVAPSQPLPANVVVFPLAAEEPPPAAAVEVEEIPVERRQRRLDDDIDPQLLPIFLEEANELVPSVGQTLRDWRANPDNPTVGHGLQRLLHTLKGSARMCGAMALGELTHAMETKVENAMGLKSLPSTLFDELEASFDRMGVLYDYLQNPDKAKRERAAAAVQETVPAAPVPVEPAAEAQEAAPIPVAAAAAPAAPAAAVPTPAEIEQSAARAMLRVRADMIDRLVNEAGEVAIARSRIEGEMRALKGALADLTENVGRLRGQLREIEIQAESQMQSRFSQTHEFETSFDPLEFDRFTRFQEITRMMAESVNDVQTVHQTIIKTLDETDAALSAQGRLNRELQQNLMRIRMVPFQSVSERLYRIVRLAAKDLDKRAVLDIRGGQVELDRSVLERITAPFEHLLRNSVAHGIEPPAERIARGKPELGEIRIELRQEGNEVMLAVSDDGAGIDIDRVREKAIALGLMAPDAPISDHDVAEFIFHPGFSTVTEVSQIAGRGVGMDVVRSEVQALGGRVETATERGKGSRFTIYLPLTLAVTQAVLVRAGGGTYAIPAAVIEQVRHFKDAELAEARASGVASWQDRRYPFRYLPRVLGDAEFVAEPRRFTPVLFAKSGANGIAMQIDEVIGNQEIVVKNAGPLLSRIAGITGATVLGSGEILLIINPVILGQREAVADRVPVAPQPAEPEAGPPTVMIVDDSLTVRKITGRLLAREGYNVLAAKDGVDAMEQLQEHIPDVMLVDIEMPRMDGFDLARNVRGDRRLRKIPIIMITSRTAEKHRTVAKEIGVDVFLGKPYQEEELIAHIANFVKAKQEEVV